MRKRLLVTAVAITMALTTILSGCSSKKEEAADGKTTLKVWGMGSEGKLLEKMSAKFEAENPDIKVEVQALPWDQAHDKLLTAVASKTGPDVIQMGTSWIPEFADAGALLDLTEYTKEYANIDPANYFDSSLETTRFNDEYVGVPWYIDTRVLYYRTDLLESVGYKDGPSNWDELKDAATKLAARGDDMYGIDLDQKDQMFTMAYAWQNGSEPITDDMVPRFNEAPYVEAVTFLNSFFKEGLAQAVSDMDITQAFASGVKPMFVSGPWMVNILKTDAPDIEGKWAVRTVPGKESNTSFVGGSNLVVFKPSKNQEAALKYINYLSDVENQMEWLEVSDSLPARKQAWEEDVLKSDPMLKVFGEQMKDARPAPFITQWESIAQELIQASEQINVGNEDIQEQLDKVNEKAKELLAK